MQFKSYHLRRGVFVIGIMLILFGIVKKFFKTGLSAQMEQWIVSSLFISAVVLFVYMKKYKIQENEEEKAKEGTSNVSGDQKEGTGKKTENKK